MMDVKAVRQRLGLTQQQLAAQLHVTPLTIKRWESGRAAPTKAQHLGSLAILQQQHQHAAPLPPAREAPRLAAPPTEAAGRRVLRLGEAVRLMGLKDEGHGRRSDHTIRKAIKRGRLHAWKAPGYRPQYAEWCFYADDFEVWRAAHYQAHRDPRRGDREMLPGRPRNDTSTMVDYHGLSQTGVERSGNIQQLRPSPEPAMRPRLAPKLRKKA